MSQRLPSLNGLKAFEAAARHESFVSAADELGVTPAAVSQQVRGLEDYIQRRLFDRRNNGLSLTDAGRAVYPAIAQGFEQFALATQMLQAGKVPVRLVVSTLPSVAAKWLGPRLSTFLATQPGLRVALRVEEDPIDFARDDVDVRLSYGSQHYPGLVVEELVTDRVVPLCSPARLSQRVPPRSPEALMEHTLIHTDWGPAFATHPTWSEWFRAARIGEALAVRQGHWVSMSSVAIDLAVSGAGITLGQQLLARDDLRAGRLVIPFGPSLTLKAPYCLAYPHARARRAVVQHFVQWLREEVDSH